MHKATIKTKSKTKMIVFTNFGDFFEIFSMGYVDLSVIGVSTVCEVKV